MNGQIFHRNNATTLRRQSVAINACAYGQRVAAPVMPIGAPRERRVVGTIADHPTTYKVKMVKGRRRLVF